MRTINAISRLGDEFHVRYDDFGCEGVFAESGTMLRGHYGSLSTDEVRYLIWKQRQPPSWSETVCRAQFAAQL